MSAWALTRLGLKEPSTQTTPAERVCLARHAAGRRQIVEIGVMHGVTTAVLRQVMSPDGTITGIDPHEPGRLGVSFERWIAERQIAGVPRGRARLVRARSADAAREWRDAVDFLFIDGDHSWDGIHADWRAWSGHVAPGGAVALHDSRSMPGRSDLDSVRYTREVIARDPRFEVVDAVDSLTVLRRRNGPASR